jgi:hypothetical protein
MCLLRLSFRNHSHSSFGAGQIIGWRFCMFFDESMQYDEYLVVKAKDEPGYPSAGKRRTHFQQTIFLPSRTALA